MSKKESKWQRALRLAKEGKSVREIMDEGIGRTYAKKAYKQAQKERTGQPEEIKEVTPKVEITPEPVEPTIPRDLKKELEEAEKKDKEKEIPPEEGEVPRPEPFKIDARSIVHTSWQTVNSFLPKDRRKNTEQIGILTDAWTPVAEKYAASLIEKFGIEAWALWITFLIFSPEIKDTAQKQIPNIQKGLKKILPRREAK